jgi:hypothetical protein
VFYKEEDGQCDAHPTLVAASFNHYYQDFEPAISLGFRISSLGFIEPTNPILLKTRISQNFCLNVSRQQNLGRKQTRHHQNNQTSAFKETEQIHGISPYICYVFFISGWAMPHPS